MPNQKALALPDALLVRYFRSGEIDHVTAVKVSDDVVKVTLQIDRTKRTDHWRDLGGGLGFVPTTD